MTSGFTSALRHLLSVILLPGTVTVLAPVWIARSYGVTLSAPRGAGDLALVAAGAASLAVGLTLFVASLRRFVSEGRGTLVRRRIPGVLHARTTIPAARVTVERRSVRTWMGRALPTAIPSLTHLPPL